MLLEAKLQFTYTTKREAEAVKDAITPDNIKTPPGLRVETTRKNANLLTHIQCEKSIETFIATLDDLVPCISVAEQSFKVAQLKNEC